MRFLIFRESLHINLSAMESILKNYQRSKILSSFTWDTGQSFYSLELLSTMYVLDKTSQTQFQEVRLQFLELENFKYVELQLLLATVAEN